MYILLCQGWYFQCLHGMLHFDNLTLLFCNGLQIIQIVPNFCQVCIYPLMFMYVVNTILYVGCERIRKSVFAFPCRHQVYLGHEQICLMG